MALINSYVSLPEGKISTGCSASPLQQLGKSWRLQGETWGHPMSQWISHAIQMPGALCWKDRRMGRVFLGETSTFVIREIHKIGVPAK